METRKRILVVDGNNIVAKATHVSLSVVRKDARTASTNSYKTAALMYSPLITVIRMMRDFLMNHPHDSVIFAVDDKVPAFRKKLAPSYKAHREEARKNDPIKEEFYKTFKAQLQIAPDVLRSLGIHWAISRGYEADDCIAACTLVRHRSCLKTVFSEDRDFIQLVSSRTKLYRPSKGMDLESCPVGFLIKKAIIGDASDNLKGVPGVGEIGAEKIMESHRTNDLDDFFFSLNPKDKKENKVLTHAHVLRAEYKVINLRKTAKKAARNMVVTKGDLSRKKFMGLAKLHKMWDFVQAPIPVISPFERSSQYVEPDA